MPTIKLSLPIKTAASAVLAWSVALAAVHAAGEMPAGPQGKVVNGGTVKVSADNLDAAPDAGDEAAALR